ncbi:TPA: hypothetical protein WI014_001272 [Neisseria meningitidis]
MNPPKTANYLNRSWLHEYRDLIFQAVSEMKTLRQIAELLEPFAQKKGKRITPQIIHVYLKRHPFYENEDLKSVEPKSLVIVKKPTTEKEIEPLSVTKQAADEVSSSVEESRVVTKPDFETPTEPQQKAESEPAPKSTNPFSRLKGKVGKSEPDFSPESSKYS